VSLVNHFRAVTGLAVSMALVVVAASATQEQLPSCSAVPGVRQAWHEAWRALGLVRQTPASLGDRSAVRWFGTANWYPVDGRETTICGRLRDWSLYDGTDAELDIHPHITPGPDFAFAFADLPARARQSIRKCGLGGNPTPCMYGELTAADDFTRKMLVTLDPDVLKRHDEYKPHLQHAACMAGPWVTERAHPWVPEIHPSRLIWATQQPESSREVRLYAAEDSSDRFDRPGQFRAIGPRRGPLWSDTILDQALGVAYEMVDGATATIDIRRAFINGTPPPGSAGPVSLPGGATLSLDPGIEYRGDDACVVHSDNGVRHVRGLAWIGVVVAGPGDGRRRNGPATMLDIVRDGAGSLPPTDRLRSGMSDAAWLATIAPVEEIAPPTGPQLDMQVTEVQINEAGTTDFTFPNLAGSWNVSGPQEWQAFRRIIIYADISYKDSVRGDDQTEPLNERLANRTGPVISVRWRFEPAVLDGTPPRRIDVAETSARFRYGVAAWGAEKIRTYLPAGFTRHGLTTSPPQNPASVRLIVETPGIVHDRTPMSTALDISADLSDGTVTGAVALGRFLSHMPVVGATNRQLEPTDELLRLVAAGVAARDPRMRPDAIVQQIVPDWEDPPPAGTSVEAARQARIVRLHYLSVVSDSFLDPDEFAELVNLAARYAASRWPSSNVR
jgi:hypothetical protein